MHGHERRGLFQTLAKAHQHKALITCSIRVRLFHPHAPAQPDLPVLLSSQPAEGELVESVLGCGLVRGHAYGITALKKVRLGEEGAARLSMVRMRNPWGTADWTGTWSRRCRHMSDFSEVLGVQL